MSVSPGKIGSRGPGAKGRAIALMMRRHNYDPIEAMITLVTKGEELIEGEFFALPIDMRVSLHKELAQYRYPKRKAIEVNMGAGPLPIRVFSGIEGVPGSAVPDDDLDGL